MKEKSAASVAVDTEEVVDDIDEEEAILAAEQGVPVAERWQDVLLARLHRLTPDGFEEFVLYLLRLYGVELERVGGSGDEGIDGIGTAPLSPVLSSRVAVQVKRYDPNGKPVGREVVALFQRDAQTKGAERAILVTLGKFTEPARKAAIVTAPTVDLIDGERLATLVQEQKLGLRSVIQVADSVVSPDKVTPVVRWASSQRMRSNGWPDSRWAWATTSMDWYVENTTTIGLPRRPMLARLSASRAASVVGRGMSWVLMFSA